MKKLEPKRDFTMSYSDLIRLGDGTSRLIDRDVEQLAKFGVDITAKNVICGKTQELKEMPTDEELQGEVSVLTEEKDIIAEKVRVDIRGIMVRAKNAFGEETAKYRRFGTKSMKEMTDMELYSCGNRVVRTSKTYLTDLALKGLTQSIIDELENSTSILLKKIELKDDAERERDIATESRIELANELYAKINEIFDYGKQCWATSNEAKYNDYVIYDSSQAVVLPKDDSPENPPA